MGKILRQFIKNYKRNLNNPDLKILTYKDLDAILTKNGYIVNIENVKKMYKDCVSDILG